MRSVRVLVIGLLVSCYRPASSYESCAIECTSACPPGYTCDHGRCRADDSTSSCASIDAAPGSEPVPGDGPPDTDQPNACPSSYAAVGFSLSRYRFNATRAEWLTAAADCADDLTGAPFHTHLVVISSDLELSGVDALNSGMTSWIGLSDRKTQGAFLWVTDEGTTYPPAAGPPWGTNEPNMGAGLDCVENTLASLRVESCTMIRAYYCECDMSANDPTRY